MKTGFEPRTSLYDRTMLNTVSLWLKNYLMYLLHKFDEFTVPTSKRDLHWTDPGGSWFSWMRGSLLKIKGYERRLLWKNRSNGLLSASKSFIEGFYLRNNEDWRDQVVKNAITDQVAAGKAQVRILANKTSVADSLLAIGVGLWLGCS